MNRILATALVLASTLVIARTASAQEHRVKAVVPFYFTVGNFTLPPGTYTIDSAASSPDVLVLRNLDKGMKVVAMGRSNQGNPERVSALVFRKYGAQYFLRQIRTEGASINVDFSATKAEKRARERIEMAGRFVDDPVLVALNQ